MNDWSGDIQAVLRSLGRKAVIAARAASAVFDDDPFEVLCYGGFGSRQRAWLHGRVVEKRDLTSTAGDSTLRNVLNTWRRADSDPLRFADVKIEHLGRTVTVRADDEGYFGGWIEPAKEPSDNEWQEYHVTLESPVPSETGPVKGSGDILMPAATARFGIISDIDDTVIQSRVSSFIRAARTVMLGNARTRLPFPGVAAFYRALREGASGDEKNPVFYVSSSPWNIYDVISDFLDIQKIPKGPLLLRDWDIDLNALSSSRHFDHKGVAIRNIMQLYPAMPFILIGDSSQHDPEIYRHIVEEFPNRVMAIYIRDVTLNPERSTSIRKLADEILAARSTLVLAEDTLGAARHAAAQGWIDSDSLPEIGEEKRADEGSNDSKVAAPV
ncbi:MAG: phosphatase domain-containing protein [Gemmatimonadales bacterium]